MKVKFQIMAIAGLFACYFVASSCGGNIPTVKIPVESMSIELNDILVEPPVSAQVIAKGFDDDDEEPLNYFSATRTISFDSLKGIAEDAMAQILEYQTQILSANVGNATITFTSNGEGTFVKDFLMTTSADHTDLYIEQCTLGTALERGDDFIDFFSGHLLIFFNPVAIGAGEFTLNVSGFTDIPIGESLSIKISLGNVVLEAEVVEVTNPITL